MQCFRIGFWIIVLVLYHLKTDCVVLSINKSYVTIVISNNLEIEVNRTPLLIPLQMEAID